MEMAAKMKEKKFVIQPSRFALWLFIVSIILLFGGITSGYIVSRGIAKEHDNWEVVAIPDIFWYNTALIIVSSLMLQVGVWAGRRGDFSRVRTSLGLTMALGIFFLVGQVIAWGLLYSSGVVFGGPSSYHAGNYLYLLTGLHGFHLLSGLIFLSVVWIKSLRWKSDSGDFLALENCATYWHFLGLLWVYLFVFLLFVHD